LTFCATYPTCVDAFFREATRRNMRMIGGKVLMDRNAPAGLLDTAEQGFKDSQALLERWNGTGRNHYAITPPVRPHQLGRAAVCLGCGFRGGPIFPAIFVGVVGRDGRGRPPCTAADRRRPGSRGRPPAPGVRRRLPERAAVDRGEPAGVVEAPAVGDRGDRQVAGEQVRPGVLQLDLPQIPRG
jgi:hypothetical protein